MCLWPFEFEEAVFENVCVCCSFFKIQNRRNGCQNNRTGLTRSFQLGDDDDDDTRQTLRYVALTRAFCAGDLWPAPHFRITTTSCWAHSSWLLRWHMWCDLWASASNTTASPQLFASLSHKSIPLFYNINGTRIYPNLPQFKCRNRIGIRWGF